MASGLQAGKRKRAFANAFTQLATIVGTFFRAQLFGQKGWIARPADRCHRFDLKLVGDLQFGPGALVVEALHAMNDEALAESLQGEVLPGGPTIVGMSNGRFAVMFEVLVRDENDEGGGVLSPGFVSFHQ